jgi:hypothetical protein
LLQAVADLIARHKRIHVVYVEGHADGTGDDAHNQWLSFYRAEEVLLRLRKLGAPRFKVRAFGRGADQPTSPEESSEGRAANRRVVFHVEWRARTPRPAAGPAKGAAVAQRRAAPASAPSKPAPAAAARARPARSVGPEGQALEKLGPLLRKLERLGGRPRPGATR